MIRNECVHSPASTPGEGKRAVVAAIFDYATVFRHAELITDAGCREQRTRGEEHRGHQQRFHFNGFNGKLNHRGQHRAMKPRSDPRLRLPPTPRSEIFRLPFISAHGPMKSLPESLALRRSGEARHHSPASPSSE